MLSLEQDTKGRELLRNLSFKGITAALDSEWDDVRALGIELLNGLVTE
jgi:phosphonate transport system substrate-binding protein